MCYMLRAVHPWGASACTPLPSKYLLIIFSKLVCVIIKNSVAVASAACIVGGISRDSGSGSSCIADATPITVINFVLWSIFVV
jgi:hypothetical protein